MRVLKSMAVTFGLVVGIAAMAVGSVVKAGESEPMFEVVKAHGNLVPHVTCRNIESGEATVEHAADCAHLEPEAESGAGESDPLFEVVKAHGNLVSHVTCRNIESGEATMETAKDCAHLEPEAESVSKG